MLLIFLGGLLYSSWSNQKTKHSERLTHKDFIRGQRGLGPALLINWLRIFARTTLLEKSIWPHKILLWRTKLTGSDHPGTLCVLVTQWCLTLHDPMDHSLRGSSVHGILQARILEWVAMPSSRGSSQPRDRMQVSCIEVTLFTDWSTPEGRQHYEMGQIQESWNL